MSRPSRGDDTAGAGAHGTLTAMDETPERLASRMAQAYRRDPEAFRRQIREVVRRLAELWRQLVEQARAALRRLAVAYAEARSRSAVQVMAERIPQLVRPVETMGPLRPIAFSAGFTTGGPAVHAVPGDTVHYQVRPTLDGAAIDSAISQLQTIFAQGATKARFGKL